MPPPIPKSKLGPSHCSVLFNDTIYSYSEEAFQSLRLDKGAEWVELPLLFGTQGAACVHGHRGTPQEALYVVGGRTSNATITPQNGFMGLQRYTFAQKKWESLSTPDPVLYNVTDHGAVFLEDTQDLFVFAGTRWPDEQKPSTMTFLIKTSEPFTITSVPTDRTPPLNAPLVLPWGKDGALVLGGNEQNTNLFTYSPTAGWADLGIKLAEGLPSRGKSSASLIEGDDGSRMLLTFDMTVAPTKAVRTQVLAGQQISTVNSGGDSFGGVVGLTEKNWPSYNGSLAPEEPRDGVAVASEGSLIIFTGGSEEDPLCIFEARENHWVNATALFSTSSTTTTTNTGDEGTPKELPSSLPSITSTPTDVPVGGTAGGSSLSTVQLLGIVLGSILGVALLLGLLLFFLKKRRAEREKVGGGRKFDKGRMSFQDRGVSFMKEAGLGRRGTNANRGGAGARAAVNDEPLAPPNARNRSSGWSKYFSGNSATNLVNLPSRTYNRTSSVYEAETSQRMSNSTRYPYHSGASGLIPPGKSIETMNNTDPMPPKTPNSARSQGLVLDLPGVGLGVNPDHFSTKKREVERRGSDMTISSVGGSSYSSGIPESIVEKEIWSPVGNSAVQNSPRGWGVLMTENRASSVYPESAVTVWPDGSERRRNDNNLRDSDFSDQQRMPASYDNNKDDMSWLNLKQT